MNEKIEVIYDENGNYLIKYDTMALELDQQEADQLLTDLASAMKATYYKRQAESKLS